MTTSHTIRHRRCWQIAVVGLFLFSLCLHGSIAQTDTRTAPSKQHLISVSYVPDAFEQTTFGLPLVKVILNGTTSTTFLVDTGSDSSVISRSLAEKLGLPLVPAVTDAGRPYSYLGGPEQSTMGRVAKVDIGGMIFINTDMVVADEKTFMLRPGIPYDGIIGMRLLRYVALLLDTRQHTLMFCYPGALEGPTLTRLKFTASYLLPLTEDNGVYWIQGYFHNQDVRREERLMLDIGATNTHISGLLAKQLDLKSISKRQQRGLYGDSVVDIVKVGEVRLGDLTLRDFPVAAITKRMLTKTLAAPSLLGLDILSDYRVLMDFPAGKLYLQPHPSPIPTITIGPTPATSPAK